MRSLLYPIWLIDCGSPPLLTLCLTSCVTNICRCSPEAIFYIKSTNPCELADILSACLLHEREGKKDYRQERGGRRGGERASEGKAGKIPSPIPSRSVSICETEKRKRRLGAALKALKKPRSPPGQICEMRKWLRGQKAGGR